MRNLFRRRGFKPEEHAFWHLTVDNDGYVMNMEAVHQFLDGFGMLDKHVFRFMATPKGVNFWLRRPPTHEIKRVFRIWKESSQI